jgi:protein-disulfide isomerase
MATSTKSKRPEHPEHPQRLSRRLERRQAAERAARRRWAIRLLAGVALALALIAALVVADRWNEDEAPPIVVPAAAMPNLPIAGRVIGEPNAPVKVVEYGDYQCPGCGFFARELEHRLIDDYVSTGQVSFEYRDFAFIGDDSVRAAEAAFCALDQGAFWLYHRTLFLNQDGENKGAFRESRLRAIAERLDLDTARFEQCLSDESYQDEVEATRQEARALGISGTPSFVINGTLIEYRGYDSVTAAIENALATR